MTIGHSATHALPGPHDTLRQELPNGITVLARENPASPAVVITGYLEAGNQDEPTDQAGLSSFTTDAMMRGSRKRSFEDLYEEVESIGAAFGLSSGTHITSFSARGLADSLPLLLDIVADILRFPSFEPQQVEKVRAEILTDLQEREHNTRRMAALTFYQLAYPEHHPYHRSVTGYPHTVNAITREQLQDHHRRFFSPHNMRVIVVGAVKPERAVQAVAEAFGEWEHSRPPRSELALLGPLTERREKRISIADKTQSNLILGWPGPMRRHPDYIACFVANTILGVFGMYGRLGQSIREDKGLAYYVYSQLEGGMGPGPWRVVAGVNPNHVEQTIELILQEVHRLRETPVEITELQDAVSYLVGSLPLHLETNEGVARALVNLERYNLGLDYLWRYRELIEAITPDSVQEVARRWLDPERYALAVANPVSEEKQ